MIPLEKAAQVSLAVDRDLLTHDIGDVEWKDTVIDGIRIVAFQGSQSIRDWVGNAIAFKTQFEGTKVHSGFLYQALQAYAAIPEGVDLVIGHSLGGAIAQILALKWGTPCITFGSPRVGNKEFAKRIEPLHTRVVNAGDPVVHVPFSFWGFKHGGNTISVGGPWRAPWPKWHSMKKYLSEISI